MVINNTFNLFMINMNKLYKYALGLLTAFTLSFACFSNAESGDVVKLGNTKSSSTIVNVPTSNWYDLENYMYNGLYDYQRDVINPSGIYEIHVDDSVLFTCIQTNEGNVGQYSLDNSSWYNTWNNEIGCIEDKTFYLRNGSIKLFYFFEGDGYIPNQYTSLQCQTEYNLIPIEDVNANYCNLNFGMIDPRECPTTEGTGAISWTPRFINDEQYPGTNLLNINIPEDIAHTVIYNEEETIVNVEGYNADENYINGILQKEKLTPTNEDIEGMITGFMLNYFPYLALTIIFLYLARKIFKIFK